MSGWVVTAPTRRRNGNWPGVERHMMVEWGYRCPCPGPPLTLVQLRSIRALFDPEYKAAVAMVYGDLFMLFFRPTRYERHMRKLLRCTSWPEVNLEHDDTQQ